MATSFPYQPLDVSVDCIRLLKFDDDVSAESIKFELVHATFASKPKYDALSYTWGSPDLAKTITIDGHEVVIRENLYWALFNVRKGMDRQLIWVDAICINQDDLEERNRQVSLMAFIYSRAQSVLVWLGRPKMTPLEMNMYQMGLGDEAVYKLRDADYWKRVWIVQDIGLARKISCFFDFYNRTIVRDWNSFMETLKHKLNRPDDDGKALLPLKLKKHREGRHGDMNQLERLLESFENAECQELRDKIYGFLGLAHDCQNGGPAVDYSKSFFHLYGEVIDFQQNAKPLKDPLPPDIDREMRLVSFSSLLQRMLEGKVDEEVIALSPHPDLTIASFTARGLIQGFICHIGPSYGDAISSFEYEKKWKASFELYYDSPDALSQLRHQDEDYTSKLLDMSERDLAKICNFTGPLHIDDLWDARISLGANWLPNNMSHEPAGSVLRCNVLEEMNPPEKRNRVNEPRRFLGSRCFIGLAPADAQEGDFICRFWGCNIAAVIRAVSDEHFRIVGRADVSTPWEQIEQPARNRFDSSYVGEVAYLKLDILTLQKLTR